MKTFKDNQAGQIVRFLHCGGLALALIFTMSQTSQAQIVPASQINIGGTVPEIRFLDTTAGADQWELEAFDNSAFEISENGSNTGEGFFKIFPNASEDLLTLRNNSVIIGGEAETESALDLSIIGNSFFVGIDLGFPDLPAGAEIRASSLLNNFSIHGRSGEEGSMFFKTIFSASLDSPSSSLTIDGDGDVGIGLLDAEASLHVMRNDGTARLVVEEASSTTADRSLMRLTNNGPSRLEFTNTDSGRTWSLVADFNNQFQIRQNGPNTANFAIRENGTFSFNNGGQSVMALLPTGNLRISGVLTEQSDRNSKENIEKVNASDVLAKVIDLPVSKWNYIDDESDSSHVGPMAQDFHAAFGLGDDDKSIATLDTSGVALAAIQGLNEKMQGLNDDLEAKNGEVEDLQKRIERLEKLVEALSAQ